MVSHLVAGDGTVATNVEGRHLVVIEPILGNVLVVDVEST